MKIKFFNKKIIWIISLVVVLGLLFTNSALAAEGEGWLDGLIGMGMGSIKASVVGWAATGIGYVMAWIASVLFTIAGFLVSLAIKMNMHIIDSPTVKIGWSIVLNFANLGFVLAIIVIAFATILRQESYGVKSVLWKLIVAALLVNFSLVIAGAFINLANFFTVYFLEKSTLTGPDSFSSAFAGILEVQGLLSVDAIMQGGISFEGAGSMGVGLLNTVASIFFIAFFTLLGALALLATAVMLFIRYIALGILLILSPLVWLLWIFPSTAGYWKKWWNTFIEWVFFAPITLFFLYLAVIAANNHHSEFINMANEAAQGFPTTVSSGLSVIGNLVIVLGLIFGGLIVAKKLSGSGGAIFYGWAEKASYGIGNWTKKRGFQYGTGWLSKKGPKPDDKSRAEKLTEWSSKSKVRKLTTGWLAQGITKLSTKGGEDLVKHYEKEVGAMSSAEAKAAYKTASWLTASAPHKIALLKRLGKEGALGDLNVKEIFTDENKSKFIRFNQGKAFSDLQNQGLFSVEINNALKTADPIKRAEELEKATNDLMSKFTKKEVAMASFKDMYSGNAKFGFDADSLKILSQYIAGAIATTNSALVANIIPKFDSKSRKIFTTVYEDAISNMSQDTKDHFEKTMNNYAVGWSPEEATSAAEAPKA
ncbi:MAG: hypothetical protein AAB596_00135 [Patescibacteria group bacterium]